MRAHLWLEVSLCGGWRLWSHRFVSRVPDITSPVGQGETVMERGERVEDGIRFGEEGGEVLEFRSNWKDPNSS